MRCIISGASGFLGKSLLHGLPGDNLGISRSENNFADQLDLTDNEAVQVFIKNHSIYHYDSFIHCAGIVPWGNNIDFRKDHIIAKNVVAICKKLNIKKLLFMSGWIVYSPDTKVPYLEKSVLRPGSAYGKSKLQQERFFAEQLKIYDIAVVSMRLASVYGPGQTTPGLIPNCVAEALSNATITIGALQTKRDYLYVGDYIKIVEKILNDNTPESYVINIGSGVSHSVQDVAKQIQIVMRTEINKIVEIKKPEPINESPIQDNRLDITLLQSKYNFSYTSLEKGLKQYIRWVIDGAIQS